MTEELPRGWALVSLGEVGKYFNGRAFKPVEWEKKGLPIIRIQNLNNLSAPFNYSTRTFDDRVKVKNGDLLIAWSASLGAFIWERGDAWLNQHIFRVEPTASLCTKEYLYYVVQYVLTDLYDKAHGSGMIHVTKPIFESQDVPLPPLQEQQRIVRRLHQVTKQVNSCSARLVSVPKMILRFRQSVLAAACSGRITAEWREKHNNDTALHSRNVCSQADLNIEEITDTPDEWTWAMLNSVCDPNRSICYGVIKLGIEHKHGIPCLRTSDVKPLRIDTADVKRIDPLISGQFGRTVLCGGEVLVNVRGTLGGVAVVPVEFRGWNISREVAVVPVSTANPEYVAYWIASLSAQKWLTAVVKGVAYSGINIEDLRQLPVALPSTEEQEEIVRRVKSLLALADKIEVRYKAVQQQVDRLPLSVLAKAFQGELVPTEAELAERDGRAYESAEELLKRIRHSREAAPLGGRKRVKGVARSK